VQDRSAEHRKFLVQANHQSSRDFDKAVMTLAAGALALSVTFMKAIAPAPEPGSLFWLRFSWGLLVLSLLAILVSFLLSQYATRNAIKELDERRAKGQPGGAWSRLTSALNVLAAGTLVLGLGFFLVFASNNLPTQGGIVSEERTNNGRDRVSPNADSHPATEKKGYVPVSAPPSPSPQDTTDGGTDSGQAGNQGGGSEGDSGKDQ